MIAPPIKPTAVSAAASAARGRRSASPAPCCSALSETALIAAAGASSPGSLDWARADAPGDDRGAGHGPARALAVHPLPGVRRSAAALALGPPRRADADRAGGA